jgi:signal transduction histidine kinase
VQDNGIGIAAKDRDKAFVLFKQLHNRGVYAGTGIGLAYCKKIVELHGGDMRIEEAPGGGTVFYFTINPIQYEKA